MYAKTPPKPDEIFNPKFIYLCQTKGCGADISEFPAGEKNPPPKWCKDCQTKSVREQIEKESTPIKNVV